LWLQLQLLLLLLLLNSLAVDTNSMTPFFAFVASRTSFHKSQFELRGFH